jgi:hypothetical protein
VSDTTRSKPVCAQPNESSRGVQAQGHSRAST